MAHPDRLAPWQVSADDFPAGAPLRDQLAFLMRYAILAPSSHNTQPWAFRVTADTVELRADRTRALPVVDPHHRELTISCGAALLNLRLAARRFGLRPIVDALPDRTDPDLLARVRIAGHAPPSGEERRLFEAIPHRHTNRRPFDPRPVPGPVVAALSAAVAAEGAWLAILEDKRRVAELIAEGDRRQMSDPRFRRELSRWLIPNRSPRRDGIPGYALGMGNLASSVGPLLVRTLDLGRAQAARDHHLALTAPLLVVLGTPTDTPHDWLTAGQALERLLLTAQAESLQASYLNQPIQVPDLRPTLATLCPRQGHPQLLLRLGPAPPTTPTPRHPIP